MTTIMEKTAGLVAFVRTVEAGSFANASRMIGSSPSAVSKSVARLEDRLGVRLFQRSTRNLSLTAEGSSYYERVASVIQAIEDADDAVQFKETARGLLRISLPVLLGQEVIIPLARAFIAEHPNVKLEMSLSDRHVDVVREGYDMALRMGQLQDSSLVSRKLAELRVVIVGSPNYLEQHGEPSTPDALRSHSCLRYVLAGRAYPWTFTDGRSSTFDGPLDTDDGVALRQFAVAGAGLAQLPFFAVANEISAGRLVEVLLNDQPPTMPLQLLHGFGRQLPVRARLFSDFIAEEFKRIEL